MKLFTSRSYTFEFTEEELLAIYTFLKNVNAENLCQDHPVRELYWECKLTLSELV